MEKFRTFLSLVCLLIPFLLSGCWDQTEIDKKAFVVGIGLDKTKSKNIKVSYLISNPEYASQQGGGNSQEPPTEIISFETNDVIASQDLANTVIAKDISYDLLTVIVVSKDFAKDKNFIRWMYDTTKDKEIKRNTLLLVTKEKAFDFIMKNKPKLETRPHKYFSIIFEKGSDTGLIPYSQIINYFRVTEADADLFLAAFGTSQLNKSNNKNKLLAGQFKIEGKTNKTQLLGSAVFKEGAMIGTLTGEETRTSRLLNEESKMPDFIRTFPDPFNDKYHITTRIFKIKNNKKSMTIKNGIPTIYIQIPLYVEILTDHSMVNYSTDEIKRKKMQKYLNQTILTDIQKLVYKTQNTFKGEPFGWSYTARKYFTTIPEYETFDWMKSYPNMKIKVSLDVKYGKFGRQIELPPIKNVRD